MPEKREAVKKLLPYLSRRDFIKTAGLDIVGVALTTLPLLPSCGVKTFIQTQTTTPAPSTITLPGTTVTTTPPPTTVTLTPAPLTVTRAFTTTVTAAASAPAATVTVTQTLTPPPATTTRPLQTRADELSYLILADPATVDEGRLPVTPLDMLHVATAAPPVDMTGYVLEVYGLVDRPLRITYDMFLAYPHTRQTALLICPGAFADHPEWSGVPVADLLAAAGIGAQAGVVTFHSVQDEPRQMPLSQVLGPGVLLADTVAGAVLPAVHGYPLRLVKPGYYGSEWLKWVRAVEVR